MNRLRRETGIAEAIRIRCQLTNTRVYVKVTDGTWFKGDFLNTARLREESAHPAMNWLYSLETAAETIATKSGTVAFRIFRS